MQACPYDALYIDPKNNTAAKCNFCAHRVDIGLQPSCEIVCPTQRLLGVGVTRVGLRHRIALELEADRLIAERRTREDARREHVVSAGFELEAADRRRATHALGAEPRRPARRAGGVRDRLVP